MKTNAKSIVAPPMRSQHGFALVVTLSLIILLTILAVGLLSLSSISLRSSENALAMSTARSNARMALMLAIGELQKNAGADMRVTATADSLIGPSDSTTAKSPVLGAWRSWENSDLDSTSKPLIPNYASKQDPSAGSGSAGRFMGWLLSTPSTSVPDATSPPSVVRTATSLKLVSTGTLGTEPAAGSEVHLPPVKVTGTDGKTTGTYAWWVSGENAKANLALKKPAPASVVESRDLMASGARPDEETFSIKFSNPNTEGNLISLKTLDLAATTPQPVSRNFHHITTNSIGLLTNTAGGGWRKDLSLLSEYGLAGSTGAPSPSDLFYPFATPNTLGTANWAKAGATVGWGGLLDYMVQYKQQASPAGLNGIAGFTTRAAPIGTGSMEDTFSRNVRCISVADSRNILSYSAVKVPSKPGIYNPAIVMNPVMTIWNPRNYRITINNLTVTHASLPLGLRMRITDGASTIVDGEIPFRTLVNSANNISERTKLRLNLRNSTGGPELILEPGETRVFSPEKATPVTVTPGANVSYDIFLRPGYRTYGGYRLKIPDPSGGFYQAGPNATFQINEIVPVANVATTNTAPSSNTGMFMNIDANINGVYFAYSYKRFFFEDPAEVAKWFKPITGLPATTVGVAAASNLVFASTVLNNRTVNDTMVPGRIGYQSNPLTIYDESGRYRVARIGSQHPVNTPYEFAVKGHTGWLDSLIADNQGRVVTGSGGDNGLSRCILAEVPLRPVRSLGELQNFQLRGFNRAPPFRTNIIGNSVAYPLFGPDEIMPSVAPGAGEGVRVQWDDSYIANRVLFDDWFVSSIAPDTSSWSGGTSRELVDVYSTHISGAKPLPNSQYVPTASATAADLTEDTRHSTIASRLEVRGMFNVNSTSIEAWTALLSHARDIDVPVLSATGVTTATDEGHAVSRTTTAGDLSSDDSLSDEQKFAGHRRLTDNQIKALATEIVKQIRLRGPALSLSEFVNRQLKSGSDEDLALAGPIQAALNELAKQSGENNPFRELQGLCKEITPANVPADASYQFSKAALGWSGEGLPGWITQADILRPIAPSLSARDDTFVIRTCGTALAPDGKTVLAKAWCEAVVQRKADYIAVDSGQDPAADANLTGANKNINEAFGRRFHIVSFRYLAESEI